MDTIEIKILQSKTKRKQILESTKEWAIKIAEISAPDEIDLAPFVVEAFIEGGKSRAKLLNSSGGGVAGGIGLGSSEAILAWILQGIVQSAKWLRLILTSKGTSNFLGVIKELLGIVNQKRNPQEKLNSMPDNPYEPLKRIIEVMPTELKKGGMSDDRAYKTTLKVVCALLENPDSAKLFIKQLESKS